MSDSWQWQFVADAGPLTQRFTLLNSVTIRVVRENLPVGTVVLATADDGGVVEVPITGPYLRLVITTPVDEPEGFEFSGDVLVVRKLYGFSRDPDDGLVVFEGAGFETGGEITLIDHVPNPLETWYYTVFVENSATGKWAFCPSTCHERDFALRNEVVDGAPWSRHGAAIFAEQTAYARDVDRHHDDALWRVCQVFGRLFDAADDVFDAHLLTSSDVENVDAARLPYIDWLLGWQTNFELNEIRRRAETASVIPLWRRRGAQSALESIVGTVTTWEARVYEGWRYVLFSFDGESIAEDSPPDDWDEETDGDWAAIVRSHPRNVSFDDRDPRARLLHPERSTLCVTISDEDLGTMGVGMPWRSIYGFAVVIAAVPEVSGLLTPTVVGKARRMIELFLPHYASAELMVDDTHRDPVGVVVDEEWDVDYEDGIAARAMTPMGLFFGL